MAATRRKVKHVVADSGAFIRNAPLRNIGHQIYTLPDVVDEIKDKATKQRLQFLPYQLEYRKPMPEAVKIVTEFSKKTGDYPSLSATDIKVLALAYQLEKEYVGTKHIKTTPDTKIEINLSTPTPSEPTQIAGFYLGTETSARSRTTSESVNSETTDSVDNVTEALEHQTLQDSGAEDNSVSEKVETSNTVNTHSCEKQQEETPVPRSSEGQETFMKEAEVSKSFKKLQITEESEKEESSTVQKIYNELRGDSMGDGHVNGLTDEEEFPSLLNSNKTWGTHTTEPMQVYVEVRDTSDASPLFDDEDDFPTLSSGTSNVGSILCALGAPKVGTEFEDESSNDHPPLCDDSGYPALSNSQYPSLSNTEYPTLSQDPANSHSDLIEKDKNEIGSEWMNSNRTDVSSSSAVWDKKPLSYAKIIQEGQAKVQPAPAVKRVFHEGQILPSNIIDDEEESEKEDDADEGIGEDDGEGWITPSNIKEVKKQMGMVDKEQVDVIVGCLTTDFAMQNVLIQMGLNVISVDGMLIKKAKSYVLRCFACFKLTSNMEKLFCPHCGNHTLKRIAMTVNEDGTIKYFFSRRKQLSTRGLRQSLPAPKGGKHAHNPLLVADQPLPHQRPSRKALQSMDVFDPDFVASESPFSKRDVTSRAAQLGIMRRGEGGGHRHQIRGKSSGRKK